MMKRERIIFTLWWMMGWLGICMAHAADRDSLRIAFIADAHVQDVVGHPELVRSMEVQVQSTRLFNEL